MDHLNEFQQRILKECLKKGSGGLSLPMGSGKTLISLSLALEHIKNRNTAATASTACVRSTPLGPPIIGGGGGGKCLIVVSKTLIESWTTEIKKFFFGEEEEEEEDTTVVKYKVYHQSFMPKREYDSYVPSDDTNLIITTPEMLMKRYQQYRIESKFVTKEERIQHGLHFPVVVNVYNPPPSSMPFLPHSMVTDGGFLYSYAWNCVLVDEVQTYTNVETQRCQAIASLCARHKWALSGTIFNEPKVERVLGYHLIIGDETFPRCLPKSALHVRSQEFKGYKQTMVHRETNDAFVPPKVNERIIAHGLSDEEYKIYQSLKTVVQTVQKDLKAYQTAGNRPMARLFSSYLMVMITYLRQFIVCPLIPYASMAIAMTDLSVKNDMADIFKDAIRSLEIDEYLNDVDSMKSTRIISVLKCVDDHRDELVIVFTCFRTNLKVLKRYMPSDRPNFTIDPLHTAQKRAEIIESFRASRNGILLLTYKLGSEGLNLQFCSTVMLSDFWWNSGTTHQAIARVLRFGQLAKEVNVYFFTSNTGIEEAIFNKHNNKNAVLKDLAVGPIKEAKIKAMTIKQILKFINQQDNVDLIKKTLE